MAGPAQLILFAPDCASCVIAPDRPAAGQTVETNRGWSLALTRDPSTPEYLLNSQAYSISPDGSSISKYNGPNPDAPYFGQLIYQDSPGHYVYVGNKGIVATYA